MEREVESKHVDLKLVTAVAGRLARDLKLGMSREMDNKEEEEAKMKASAGSDFVMRVEPVQEQKFNEIEIQ